MAACGDSSTGGDSTVIASNEPAAVDAGANAGTITETPPVNPGNGNTGNVEDVAGEVPTNTPVQTPVATPVATPVESPVETPPETATDPDNSVSETIDPAFLNADSALSHIGERLPNGPAALPGSQFVSEIGRSRIAATPEHSL